MNGLIANFPYDGVVTVNRVVLKSEYTTDDLQERVALLCENVKTYHSDQGFIGGFVVLNSGRISNEGSAIGRAVHAEFEGREGLIVTFWESFLQHERSHHSSTFQPLFKQALDLCENGNEEIAYDMLWSGRAYNAEESAAARQAKQRFSSEEIITPDKQRLRGA